MNTKLLRDTFAVCFQDYVKRTNITPAERNTPREVQVSRAAKRESIGELFGATPDTFYCWTAGFNKPQSIGLRRLVLALESIGYEITDKGPKSRRDLLAALALGVITLDKATDMLGYSKSHSVSTYVLGSTNSSAAKEAILADFLGNVAPEIQEKTLTLVRKFRELSGLPDQAESAAPQVRAVEVHHEFSQAKTIDANGAVAGLASHIMAAIPLAKVLKEGNGQKGTEDRRKLRELTAMGVSNGVFELSNLLNALCGEKAKNKSEGGF